MTADFPVTLWVAKPSVNHGATNAPLPWASVHWMVQCTLECHWLTKCTLGHHWATQRILAGYTGTPLENLSWNRPTLECHWRNSNFCSLHWNITGETVAAHTHTISKWTGLCKFSSYLEFTAQQWIPVLLSKYVSTWPSLCACLWYEDHYSFCVFGVASQMKSV